MSKLLEAVMSEFHSWLTCLHGFAAWFFGRRAFRHYNEFKPKRGLFWLLVWCGFHVLCATVSFVASRIHKRDSR